VGVVASCRTGARDHWSFPSGEAAGERPRHVEVEQDAVAVCCGSCSRPLQTRCPAAAPRAATPAYPLLLCLGVLLLESDDEVDVGRSRCRRFSSLAVRVLRVPRMPSASPAAASLAVRALRPHGGAAREMVRWRSRGRGSLASLMAMAEWAERCKIWGERRGR
jgi:hypothetical protein